MKLAIFCDFDETITATNVTDAVLEKFADPLWRAIQADWVAGKMSAREVLQKQMPLITARSRELDAFIDTVEVDPFFRNFLRLCAKNNDSVSILSDGFDYWIERILRREGSRLDGAIDQIKIFSCSLRLDGGRVAISFPFFPQGCIHGCATCKPALFDRLRAGAEKTIVIGDGVSDILLADKADLVLAKSALGKFCRQKGIHCRRFKDFRDVIRIINTFRLDLLEAHDG